MVKRRFRIPKRIKIGRTVWKVYQEPKTTPFRKKHGKGKTLMQEGCLGICYRTKKVREIHLAKHLKGRKLEMVFCHEMLHACMPVAPIVSYYVEERLVEELDTPVADAIGALFRFNKRAKKTKKGL